MLDRAQVTALLAAVRGDRLEAFYTLAVLTGLRDAELRALRWSDVDLDTGTIAISGQHQYVNGRLERVATKTESSNRDLPIGEGLPAVLRAHRARQNKERLRTGNLWADGDYVFTRTDGQPLTPTGRRVHWTALRERLGLPAGMRFHDLRHTAATCMLAAETPAKVIQNTLGHSAIRTTMDLYSQTLPEGMRRNADAGRAARGISGQDKWSVRAELVLRTANL